MDSRIKKLADVLVHYSCNVQKGEKVLISYEGESTKSLAKLLIKEVYACGGLPYVEIRDSSLTREILLSCEEDQLKFMNDYLLTQNAGHGRLHCSARKRQHRRTVRRSLSKDEHVQ